jgi:CBS domain-containing protein
MTDEPILANIDMPVADAAAILDFYRISGLPIVDWDGVLVGVLTQTDLLHARADDATWASWANLTVRDLMTSPALSVTADVVLEDAARFMDSHRIHRLVVTSADGETPIGVLSVSDLVHAMALRGDA